METIIELVWKRQEEMFAGHTVYKAFARGVEVEYVIIANESGVHLGVSKSDSENIETHAMNDSAYPFMDDYTMLNFKLIPDKMEWTIKKGKKPNSGTITGTQIEISAFEIAKTFAQNMFNKKVQSFRNMMKICA